VALIRNRSFIFYLLINNLIVDEFELLRDISSDAILEFYKNLMLYFLKIIRAISKYLKSSKFLNKRHYQNSDE